MSSRLHDSNGQAKMARIFLATAVTSIALSINSAKRADGRPTQPVTVVDRRVASSATAGHLLYVSNDKPRGTVAAFSVDQLHGLPALTITKVSRPTGLATDRSGNLYVAEADLSEDVAVFERGQTVRARSLSVPGEFPNAVAVDSAGTVYVASPKYVETGAPGDVAVFVGGASQPSYRIAIPNGYPLGVAIGPHDDLFIAYDIAANPAGRIYEVEKGKTIGKDLGIVLQTAAGIVVDRAGDIVAVNAEATPRSINVYPPGAKQPTVSVPLPGISGAYLAFNATQTRLFVVNCDPGHHVLSYSYPQLMQQSRFVPFPGGRCPWALAVGSK